jgi:hypothetical protein
MIANTGSQASRSATHRPPVGAVSRPGTRPASRPTELTVMNAVWCHRNRAAKCAALLASALARPTDRRGPGRMRSAPRLGRSVSGGV